MGTVLAEPGQEGQFLVSPDTRNRITFGKRMKKGLHRVTETEFGYELERVGVVSERDRALMENKEFWEKAAEGINSGNRHRLQFED